MRTAAEGSALKGYILSAVERHPALVLATLLAVFFILLGNARIASGDGETMFQVTKAMAEDARLDLPNGILAPIETILADSSDTEIAYTVVGSDGRTYSKYGLGQSLVALPLYALGMAWRAATGIAHAPRSAVTVLNSLLTAATAGLILVIARELRYSTRAGVFLSLVFALCTPAWVYTHSFFSEPLVTFCLVFTALGCVRFAWGNQTHWLVLSGGALGLAVLTRINALAALPAFGLYLILTWRAKQTQFLTVARQAAASLFALGLVGGLALLYNVARFGDPLDFGYRTSNWQAFFLVGLYGLTLSSGKGLLWYAPPVLLGMVGFPSFSRRYLREGLLCAGVLLGYILLHAFYTYWEGGWCWGPRLILPALPFALLPALPLLAQREQSRVVALGLALVLALGLLVQIPAVGASFTLPLQKAYQSSPRDFQDRVLFQPANSPLVSQWFSFFQVSANLRSETARAEVSHLIDEVQPGSSLLLSSSYQEALRLEQQAILSFNLPDLWLVSESWLHRAK